ncbi:hypothetical protein WICMUC_001622 [Wickerhamomyces mucosus]|uniref:Phosphatidylserine decarboxylase proenzyme 1, mitochondrial n=1 Tax=Wickerhamomyces mucosus TaxID=1378264 RepID=A0A9P8PTM0_9ASCO|nr:hypothetical protein WICMUC_001622 [Wickerhamomyces mucosus]
MVTTTTTITSATSITSSNAAAGAVRATASAVAKVGLVRPFMKAAKDSAIKFSTNHIGKRFLQTSINQSSKKNNNNHQGTRNSLYYNTYYYGSQLKNGIKDKIPPHIRKFSQSYQNRLNNGSSTSNDIPKSNRQLLKYIALISAGIIFYTVTVKIYQQSYEEDQRGNKNKNKNTFDDFNEKNVKPSTTWGVFCYSTLPLNAMSRLWGQVNSIVLPIWLREPGYRFYGYMFGVNFDEINESNISNFKNLSEFFYRDLKPDARKIDQLADIVCPSDGKVLQLGVIHDGNIEQVKGMTYSIDEFLGNATNHKLAAPSHSVDFNHTDPDDVLKRHEEFAQLNSISYTLDDILGGEGKNVSHLKKIIYKEEGDRGSSKPESFQVSKVVQDLTKVPKIPNQDKELFFAVIYLAPGDYHRYHSATNWVVTLRRHFIGELFSVAPYFQRTLNKLFVLNERVALLGYWKYGFFSMIPVGATNVGSIKVNFDKDLTTNTKYESPHYQLQQQQQQQDQDQEDQLRRVKKNTCYEATYSNASKVLGGFPVTKGEEIGGFMLGSTVVLVFEAPKEFKFNIVKGQKVKMGEKLGSVESN